MLAHSDVTDFTSWCEIQVSSLRAWCKLTCNFTGTGRAPKRRTSRHRGQQTESETKSGLMAGANAIIMANWTPLPIEEIELTADTM